MAVRQKYNFGLIREDGCFPQPVKRDKMPDSIEDIEKQINYNVDSDGFHYLGDERKKDGGPFKKMPASEIPRMIVTAIKDGNLEALKAIGEMELKKYLNSEILGTNYAFTKMPTPKGHVRGFTPLMLAAIEGKTDIMRYLIDLGADIGIKTFDLDHSGFSGRCTAADFLKHYKVVQEKKRAEELKKQKENDAKQKEKDELNDLMDEVDGKKPETPVKLDPKVKPIEIYPDYDELLKDEVEAYKKKMPQKSKGKPYYGHRKGGIDDVVGALEENTLVRANNGKQRA